MTPRFTAEQRQRLEALHRAYLRDLPGKLRAIERAAASLSPLDPEGLRALLHLVHRLTGSSAIYGFDRLSRASAALEELLLSAAEGASLAARGGDPALAERLAALRAEAASAGDRG